MRLIHEGKSMYGFFFVHDMLGERMEKVYEGEAEQVLYDLRTDRNGLSSIEAEKRKVQYDENRLARTKKKSNIQRFFEELKDPMLLMLLAADTISAITNHIAGESMAEVLGVFLATLCEFTLLEPVHLLFVNLITDCFLALALGMEKGEEDIMKRKPRDSKESIFAHGMMGDIIFQGLVIAGLTLVSYIIGHSMEAGHFEIPVVANLFGFTSVEWNEYMIALVLAFLLIGIADIILFGCILLRNY